MNTRFPEADLDIDILADDLPRDQVGLTQDSVEVRLLNTITDVCRKGRRDAASIARLSFEYGLDLTSEPSMIAVKTIDRIRVLAR
jgi:hypothetical protein